MRPERREAGQYETRMAFGQLVSRFRGFCDFDLGGGDEGLQTQALDGGEGDSVVTLAALIQHPACPLRNGRSWWLPTAAPGVWSRIEHARSGSRPRVSRLPIWMRDDGKRSHPLFVGDAGGSLR
jgi:hypothetical protein